MNFRYDFGQKIDLTKFRKQALHYIKVCTENEWEFYISTYKIHFSARHFGYLFYKFELEMFELKKDDSGEIVERTLIRPLENTKFKNVQAFHAFYNANFAWQTATSINSSDIDFIVDSLIDVLKYISKIEKLKAFL